MKLLVALNNRTTKAGIGETWKQTIKQDVSSAISESLEQVAIDLRELCGEDLGARAAQLVASRLQIFKGLETEKLENKILRAKMPHLKIYERKVGPTSEDVAYCTMIADWLQLKLDHDLRCIYSSHCVYTLLAVHLHAWDTP